MKCRTLKIEQLIDAINCNEKDIGDYEIVFRNIDKDKEIMKRNP